MSSTIMYLSKQTNKQKKAIGRNCHAKHFPLRPTEVNVLQKSQLPT